MKNEHPNVTTNPLELTHWAPFEEIVEIGSGFWKTLNLVFCITISIDPKIDKKLQKNENEAKAMPREANVRCRALPLDPGKVYQALRGVPPWH